MSVVLNHPSVLEYLEQKIGDKYGEPFQTFGFLNSEGELRAAFLLSEWTGTGGNVDLTIAAEPGGIQRGAMRFLARYIFNQLGARRISIKTRKRNKAVLKLAPRYGFKWEAVLTSYFPDDDAVLFRMTREDCQWLGKKNEHSESPQPR